MNVYSADYLTETTNDKKCHHTIINFAKLGGKVTTQTVASTKTVHDNPDGAHLNPQLRKAVEPLYAICVSPCKI